MTLILILICLSMVDDTTLKTICKNVKEASDTDVLNLYDSDVCLRLKMLIISNYPALPDRETVD